MGARLRYGKVIDRELFYKRGARVHPGLPSTVLVNEEPGVAAAFLVLRAWSDDHGTMTEQWRIEGPGGLTLYESHPREIHLPTKRHIERLQDEVSDFKIDLVDTNYSAVFLLDDEEVRRVRFDIVLEGTTA
jgi:hypothetical protein